MSTIFRVSLYFTVFIFSGATHSFAQGNTDLQKQINLKNSLSEGRVIAPKDTSWKQIQFGANLNQGSFSSNWTGGGVNSVALGVFFNALSQIKRGKNSWRNDFQSQYGVVRNKGQQSRKNVDRIFFDSKYNRELTEKWSLFGNINFLSQFSNGYEYSANADSVGYKKKVSGFFSPAYITEAIGIEYKPVSYFFIDFAPGALRQTIVTDKNLYLTMPSNYGVPIGDKVRTEVALMQIVANFNKDIAKDINLKFRYMAYSNIKHPLNIDDRLDATITAKIAKYFDVNLGVIIVYDQDQSNEVQFAQGLSVGFLYSIK